MQNSKYQLQSSYCPRTLHVVGVQWSWPSSFSKEELENEAGSQQLEKLRVELSLGVRLWYLPFSFCIPWVLWLWPNQEQLWSSINSTGHRNVLRELNRYKLLNMSVTWLYRCGIIVGGDLSIWFPPPPREGEPSGWNAVDMERIGSMVAP